MNISSLKHSEFTNAYGILCASLSKQGAREGLYPSFCRIPEGAKSTAHSHFEPELFYIVSGQGFMTIGSESSEVHADHLVHIPPFAQHELKNIGSEELVFLSVYSEDFESPRLPTSAVVTAAPPTPNGPLHIGHISGPYLASDIASRYLRLRSVEVRSHSGTDDHQNYVFEKARALGLAPDIFRKSMRLRIQNGLQKMQIGFDEFIEPKTDKEYQNKILRFVQKAIESGVIQKENINFPHCKTCDHSLIDALVNANCPSCHEPSAGGCENCGVVVPPQELLNIKCARCGEAADRKSVSVYTFSLSQYLPLIQKYLSELSLPAHLRDLIARVYQMKALKVLLTFPTSSGHELCLPDMNHALHVWFEMAAHYESFSLQDESWIHCFGFDNSFYYLLFIPSLLRALNPEVRLPDAVITNEFLLLDGMKFSTSRGHAIWADEFTGNIDHLRLYLSAHRPSTLQSDFILEKFHHFSADLEKQLQTLRNRAQQVAQKTQNEIPQLALINCNRFTREMELFLSPKSFDSRRASRHLMAFMDLTINSFENAQGERLMLQALGTLMAPFMPKESDSLLEALQESSRTWLNDWVREL